MAHPVEIRTREPNDLPDVIEAMRDVHRTDGYPVEGMDIPEAFLTPPGLLQAWVAMHSGKAVGHVVAIAGPHGDKKAAEAWSRSGGNIEQTAIVARLFIRDSARHLGLGSKLVQTVIQWGRDQGLSLVMNVLSRNADAMRLYEKQGFRRFSEGVHVNPQGEQYPQFFYAGPELI